jgi:hypothetical protein
VGDPLNDKVLNWQPEQWQGHPRWLLEIEW